MERESDKSFRRVNIEYTHVLEKLGYVQGYPEWRSEKARQANLKDEQKLCYKGLKEKWFKESELQDAFRDGWSLGRRPDIREIIRKTSKGRKHTEETKEKMSSLCKKKIYYTSPCLTKLRAIQPGEEIPEGWIRGNKLKSRNQKITESLYERHRNKKGGG